MEDIILSPLPFPEVALTVTCTALGGTINVCSGDLDITLEAVYRPKIDIFGFMPVELGVGELVIPMKFTAETLLTTGESTDDPELIGLPWDKWGDCILVGTSVVNICGIPVDIACELPVNVHIDRDINLCPVQEP